MESQKGTQHECDSTSQDTDKLTDVESPVEETKEDIVDRDNRNAKPQFEKGPLPSLEHSCSKPCAGEDLNRLVGVRPEIHGDEKKTPQVQSNTAGPMFHDRGDQTKGDQTKRKDQAGDSGTQKQSFAPLPLQKVKGDQDLKGKSQSESGQVPIRQSDTSGQDGSKMDVLPTPPSIAAQVDCTTVPAWGEFERIPEGHNRKYTIRAVDLVLPPMESTICTATLWFNTLTAVTLGDCVRLRSGKDALFIAACRHHGRYKIYVMSGNDCSDVLSSQIVGVRRLLPPYNVPKLPYYFNALQSWRRSGSRRDRNHVRCMFLKSLMGVHSSPSPTGITASQNRWLLHEVFTTKTLKQGDAKSLVHAMSEIGNAPDDERKRSHKSIQDIVMRDARREAKKIRSTRPLWRGDSLLSDDRDDFVENDPLQPAAVGNGAKAAGAKQWQGVQGAQGAQGSARPWQVGTDEEAATETVVQGLLALKDATKRGTPPQHPSSFPGPGTATSGSHGSQSRSASSKPGHATRSSNRTPILKVPKDAEAAGPLYPARLDRMGTGVESSSHSEPPRLRKDHANPPSLPPQQPPPPQPPLPPSQQHQKVSLPQASQQPQTRSGDASERLDDRTLEGLRVVYQRLESDNKRLEIANGRLEAETQRLAVESKQLGETIQKLTAEQQKLQADASSSKEREEELQRKLSDVQRAFGQVWRMIQHKSNELCLPAMDDTELRKRSLESFFFTLKVMTMDSAIEASLPELTMGKERKDSPAEETSSLPDRKSPDRKRQRI
eukprot:Rmarinus@m.17929